ncbi:MAG TPA: hypothetical protein VF587_20460, partial [Solirubrobacteraceae bacterium]
MKFRCTLDGSPVSCQRFWAPSLEADYLPAGHHKMTIAAVDNFFNVDPTPAAHEFDVDVTPPETTITSTPPSVAEDVHPLIPISFTANEAGSTFECKANHSPDFFDCSSVWNVSLNNGPVWVEVRAIDPRGNVDPTPARLAWTRDLAETQRIQAQRAWDATHPPAPTTTTQPSGTTSSPSTASVTTAGQACLP